MKRITFAVFGAFVAALVASGVGCELIANVDRSQIPGVGGSGGQPSTGGAGGVGGTGGNTGGGGATSSSSSSSGMMPCTMADQCPMPPNECVDRTCDQGVCGTANKAADTFVSLQPLGDCKRKVCDGAGAIVDANDDSDVPDDGLDCTDDVCMAGVASNPNLPLDADCGSSGGLKCDGAGNCVGCNDATQCGVDTDCQKNTCVGNVCGIMNVAQGTPVLTQATGDCKVDQCDGNGGVETVADGADLPVDGETCTKDLCVVGVPSNPAEPSATPCSEGTGTRCDGLGACVECIVAGDCPGADTECKQRACNAGVCGSTLTALGTPLASQIAGDCKKDVCDGLGGTTAQNDDADTQDDNNACTTDVCTAGVSSHPAKADGVACGSLTCLGGVCAGCSVPTDCPGVDDECKTRSCTVGACGFTFTANNTPVAMQTVGDCQKNVCNGSGNTVSVADNADAPADDGKECTTDVCQAGAPVHPAKAVDTACTQGGAFCDGSGNCVACNAPAQCPGSDTECKSRTCASHACGVAFQPVGTVTTAQTPGDCQVNQCDGAGNIVSVASNGDAPADDGNQCTSDVCQTGSPVHPPKAINTACNQGGSFCNATGTCVQCNVATQCAGSDTECHQRTCNSNTCGVNNTAVGTPTSAQTSGNCQKNQCDGSGNIVSVADNADFPADEPNDCTNDTCSAGAPVHPPKPAGTPCGSNGGVLCNAVGACVGPACNDTFKNGSETDVDCGGACPTKCALTKGCNVDGDCQSNACSGGVCVQCNAPSTCPGSDTACHTRTCNSHVCGVSNTSAGIPAGSQTPADCKQNQCDGSGNPVVVNDNADISDDGSDCTVDTCSAGSPVHTPQAPGTPCSSNGGTTCNAVGVCVSAACGDGFKNGSETDIDCGGACPTKCALTQGCIINNDCQSNACSGGFCVECNTPSTCPGSDTACQVRTCNSHVCGVSNTSPGIPAGSQTSGDCKQNQCDGSGNPISVNDNADVPADDGNDCTTDTCSAGSPVHPPKLVDTVCAGGFCDGAGACGQCNMPSQCAGSDTSCQQRTCNSHSCGTSFQANGSLGSPLLSQTSADCKKNVCNGSGGVVVQNDDLDVPPSDGNECTQDACLNGVPYPPVAVGTPTASQTSGDCKKNVCNGSGGTTAQNDDLDAPPSDGNECTQDACLNGVPYPPVALGTPTTSQTANDCKESVCNGSGGVAMQNNDADFPLSDGNECTQDACLNGVPYPPVASGTPTASQTPGDCHQNQCDGSGNTVNVVLDTDVPVDANDCTDNVCTNGAPSNPNSALNAFCDQSGGSRCDGAGACFPTFQVVRVDGGGVALTNAASATFVEERKLDATVLNTYALPTAVSGLNRRLTLSGTATSEGNLSRSADKRYVTLAGYDAATGTANAPNTTTAAVNRVVGRIDRSGVIDTTTAFTASFSATNIRSATSDNGARFWASGGNSGTQLINIGTVGAGTAVLAAPANIRFEHIFGGQLFGSSGSAGFTNVFTVGTGIPTTTGQTATVLPGLPVAGTHSPYSFVLFDTNNDGVLDLLYIADDGTLANGGGIQKWTFSIATSTWSLVKTFGTANGLSTQGVRGLAGTIISGNPVLIATTAEALPTPNKIFTITDDGSATPIATLVATAPANMAFRGVAMTPNK